MIQIKWILFAFAFIPLQLMAEDELSLEQLILKDADKLGLSETDIKAYFRFSPRKEICRDTTEDGIEIFSETVLDYSSTGSMLYLEHEPGKKPDHLYLLLPKTPYLSLRARLGRLDYEEKGHGGGWTIHTKGTLVVDLYFKQDGVYDIIGKLMRCMPDGFETSRYAVAIFSIKKTP